MATRATAKPQAAAYRPSVFIPHEYCIRCGEHAPQRDGYTAKPIIFCDTCTPRS